MFGGLVLYLVFLWILKMKTKGEKISMLTAYDALMAGIIDSAGVDIILVGDSAGMVMGGKENTLSVTMDEMVFYTKSVRQGVSNALLITDMPYLSYQINIEKAMENAGRFLQEAGAEGVKIEGGEVMAETIRSLADIGIPVMGHLGLTPQSVHALGGFRVQGKEKEHAEQLLEEIPVTANDVPVDFLVTDAGVRYFNSDIGQQVQGE